MEIMDKSTKDIIRQAVRDSYGKIANAGSAVPGLGPGESCCGQSQIETAKNSAASCCDGSDLSSEQMSTLMGYSKKDFAGVPEGANMGLGCGNPVALASLQIGETVVDLGSGGGFDCFLAAKQVGDTGRVIGIDMTPDKQEVYRDAFRILKPGGRLAIADIVAVALLPEEIQQNLALVSACVGGAATIDDTRGMLATAGFENIKITPKDESRKLISEWTPENSKNAGDYVVSAYIEATKPV
jgi:hypothetical protein